MLLAKRYQYDSCVYRMTELAYKYFFKTLNAQADRLMQSTEVPSAIETNNSHVSCKP